MFQTFILIDFQKQNLFWMIIYLQKNILNMHNIVTLITFGFSKSHNHYYYQKFLEKCSYK